MSRNIFLNQKSHYDKTQEAARISEEIEKTYGENIFLRQTPDELKKEKIKGRVHPLINVAGQATLTPKKIKNLQEKAGRNVMQSAIGLGTGALLTSPAAIPAILSDIAIPGAIEELAQEEKEFYYGLPKNLRKEIYPEEYRPEDIKEKAKKAYAEFTKGRPLHELLITAPFETAGINTTPQGPWEQATRNVSELFLGMMNPKEATTLIFDYLPTTSKKFFKNKLDQIEKMLIGDVPMDKTIFESAENALQALQEKEVPGSLVGRIKPSGKDVGIRPHIPEAELPLSKRITPGKDIGFRPSAIEAEKKPPAIPIPIQTEMPMTSLAERVSEKGSRLRAMSHEMQQILEPLGQIVSPKTFKNDEVAGNTFRKIIQNDAAIGRDLTREAYELAEAEYNDIVDTYPQLINRFQNLRDSLLESGSLNPAQQAVVKELDNILTMISTEEGTAIEVPVRRLIRTSDSLTGRLSQEDIYGDARTLLRSVSHDLNEASLKAVKRAGRNPEAMLNADRTYAEWADRFSNDEIDPFLTRRTFNPEGEYQKAVSDRGTFRAIENAIGTTPQGQAAISSLERDIVEEALEPFVKNPEKIGSRQYEKAIENLSPIIGNEKTKLIDQRLSATRTTHAERRMPKRKIEVQIPKSPFKAERKEIGATGKVPIPKVLEPQPPFKAERKEIGATGKILRPEVKLTGSERIASKYLDKKPEDIQRMANSRTGLRELRKDLIEKKGKQGKKIYNEIAGQKVRNILRQGGIEKKISGRKLYDILQNESNFDIISEIAGKEVTLEAMNLAKKFPLTNLTIGFTKKIAKFYLASELLKHLFPILKGHYSNVS